MILEVSIVFMLLFSAFFSGSETAVMAVDRYQLRTLAKEGNHNAQLLQRYIEDPDRFFGVVLLGNTFTNIAAATLFTLWLVAHISDDYLIFGTFGLSCIVLLFCEILPKSIAARYAMRIGLIIVRPLIFIETLLSPLLFVLKFIVQKVFSFGKKQDHGLDLESLRKVIQAASENLSQEERSMFEGILDLSSLSVEDVMVPKHQVNILDIEKPWAEIKEMLFTHQQEYWFVLRNGVWDDLLGVIHVTDLIRQRNKLDKEELLNHLKKVMYVQEGTYLKNQLANFKKNQNVASVVVDEYGEVVGVLDVHDIIEEVVGYYAKRPAVPLGAVRFDGEEGYWIKGHVRVRDLNRYLDWDLPEDYGVTLAGLVLQYLGTIPEGPCSLYVDSYRVEVVEMNDRDLILFHIVIV